MPSAKQRRGHRAEQIVCEHLQAQGWLLLASNWTCHWGELDLVMRDGKEIVFVEVKLRRRSDFGFPEETVTPRQQRALLRSAQKFLQQKRLHNCFWRFDTLAVLGNVENYEISHFRDTISAI